jgi:twitching motility two-component system response regulator PilH
MTIKKILVVDDSPTERHVMKTLLTSNGYEVITAESGEEGIAKAKSELPDLVLMDVVMPGLNGYQATRTLTRDQLTRNIPVIVFTTKGQETDKIWGLRQGAQDYLVKPVNGQELLAKIAAYSEAVAGMSKKISLHEFQSYLAARLAGTSNQSAAGLLGIQAGSDYWLARSRRLGRNRSADTADHSPSDQTLVRWYRQHSRQPVLGGRPVGLPRQGGNASEYQLATAADRHPSRQQRGACWSRA